MTTTISGTAWAAGMFAAVAVALALSVIAAALLRDIAGLRKRGRKLMRAYTDQHTRVQDQAGSVRALRAVIEASGDLYAEFDGDGIVLDQNAAFAALMARAGISAVSMEPAMFGQAGEGRARRLREGESEGSVAGETIRWHVQSSRRMGGALRTTVIGRNLTELRRATDGDAAKSRFLATVSHEMRTPLNGVLGMAGLLRDTGLTPEQASYVDAVQTSGEALLSLISEILDFSRIEAGKLEIVSEAVEVERLVESVVELLSPRAQDKGIEIAALVHPAVPSVVTSDGARLRQVLMNLAGNAVKFTATGGVGIRVEVAAGDRMIFTVADTGPGIAPARLSAIFEEFEQAEAATARAHGGTGLGLAITRRIVEHMGGTVSVLSRLGAGSVFQVALPLVAAAAPARVPVEPVPDLSGEHVVIVSPSPFEAPFLAERMQRFGARVTLVADPARFERALAGATVIMADACLGAEHCRALARTGADNGITRRLILLSPYERRGFGAPADAGFDGYLIKPVRLRSLAARFAAEAAVPALAVRPRLVAEEPCLAGRKILLAEDNPINALLASRLIERLGGSVTWVKDGQSAVDAAARGGFALALFDIRMPGLTGLEAAAAVRTFEAERGGGRLPLVALTANAFAEDRADCLAAGFDGFLAKPLDRDALVATLLALAGTARQAA